MTGGFAMSHNITPPSPFLLPLPQRCLLVDQIRADLEARANHALGTFAPIIGVIITQVARRTDSRYLGGVNFRTKSSR